MHIGLSLSLTGVGAYVGSLAPQSLSSSRFAGRSQGAVFNFVDDFFLEDTGHYGSVRIKDTGTPANNYDSHPYGIVTHTSPPLTLLLGPEGLYRYQAHNYALNSAAPATQNVAVLSGATYQVSITGTGSVALSGAGSGTVSAGSPVDFTAGTTTLTCTVSGSPSTIHVRRTPSDSKYLATAGAIRVDLPFEWHANGYLLGLLDETQRVNLALRASDFTNASWTKSNLTAAKTATGPDGVANSASTLTATADNATALQAITSGSSARITYCWIKRRTGTGNIDLTQDNGSTWTTVAVTGSWTKVSIASVTSANPTVGIRIVTSDDEVDIAWFQHVAAAYTSSPIETFGATATRAGSNKSIATSLMPLSATQMTLACCGEFSKLPSGAAIIAEIQASSRGDSLTNMSMATTAATFGGSVAGFSQQHLNALTPYTAGEVTTFAGSAKANDFRASQDSELAAADTSGTFQATAYASLRIGGVGGGSACLEGHIREICYFPETSTDAQLRALTVPAGTAEKAQSIHFIGDSFLNGIPITSYVRRNLTNKLRRVTKDGVGGSSLADQAARFALTPWHYGQILVIMDGGLSDTLSAAQAAIASMISKLTHDRWLFVEGGYDITTKAAGLPARDVIDSINEWIDTTYPGHFVATRTTMQSYSTGDADDLADLAADVWPRSQTIDGLHPTTTAGGGSDHLSQIIVDAIVAKAW